MYYDIIIYHSLQEDSKYVQAFFKGIIIGVANIMPGVSGGTLAVILGVYDKLTEAIGNFLTVPFKKKVEYGKFLLQICSGMLIGIILFAKIIEFSFTNYPRSTGCFFQSSYSSFNTFYCKGRR